MFDARFFIECDVAVDIGLYPFYVKHFELHSCLKSATQMKFIIIINTNINVLALSSLQVYGSLSGHEHGHITGHGRK